MKRVSYSEQSDGQQFEAVYRSIKESILEPILSAIWICLDNLTLNENFHHGVFRISLIISAIFHCVLRKLRSLYREGRYFSGNKEFGPDIPKDPSYDFLIVCNKAIDEFLRGLGEHSISLRYSISFL